MYCNIETRSKTARKPAHILMDTNFVPVKLCEVKKYPKIRKVLKIFEGDS